RIRVRPLRPRQPRQGVVRLAAARGTDRKRSLGTSHRPGLEQRSIGRVPGEAETVGGCSLSEDRHPRRPSPVHTGCTGPVPTCWPGTGAHGVYRAAFFTGAYGVHNYLEKVLAIYWGDPALRAR